ncbi:hypothetical protein BD410DRAFT_509731 [Rickenella mellea]|uniref:Uncharacterized protein n=1 Tax=Rickenella mellea TaxID=50990 RepID=A0A4Y7PU99_9AGAM|nr:hypothetical protein BD410DRAFT_509731 [Rickenella mellea]
MTLLYLYTKSIMRIHEEHRHLIDLLPIRKLSRSSAMPSRFSQGLGASMAPGQFSHFESQSTTGERSLHSPTCPPGLHLESTWTPTRVRWILEFQSRLSEDSTWSPPRLHPDTTWNMYQ